MNRDTHSERETHFETKLVREALSHAHMLLRTRTEALLHTRRKDTLRKKDSERSIARENQRMSMRIDLGLEFFWFHITTSTRDSECVRV